MRAVLSSAEPLSGEQHGFIVSFVRAGASKRTCDAVLARISQRSEKEQIHVRAHKQE